MYKFCWHSAFFLGPHLVALGPHPLWNLHHISQRCKIICIIISSQFIVKGAPTHNRSIWTPEPVRRTTGRCSASSRVPWTEKKCQVALINVHWHATRPRLRPCFCFNLQRDIGVYLSVCLSACLPTYLPIYLSIYLSICLSIHPSIYLSSYLSSYLSIYSSIYLPNLYIYLSIYLSICLSVCLSIYSSIYLPNLSICLSIYQSINLSI